MTWVLAYPLMILWLYIAFSIAERTHKEHMIKNGAAGLGWFNGFRYCHPRLVLHTPQPLSFCRASKSNMFVTDNFLPS